MRPPWLAKFGLFLLAAGVIYGLMLAPAGAAPARGQERASATHRSFPPIHGGEVNEHGLADTEASLSNAWNVELVGQFGGPISTVAVQGNYAYVGVGPRLMVLNVADPTQPKLEGRSPVLPSFVQDVFVTDGYAFLAAGGAGLHLLTVLGLARHSKL